MKNSEKWASSVKIPSDIKYIRKVSGEIEDFLKSDGVNQEVIFDIRLAVEEAVKNAIIHGNSRKNDLTVSISYFLEGNKLTVEVEDMGKGFKPANVPDPRCDENLLKTGGRGVLLIKELMDEVQYNSMGNKVVMLKYIERDKGGTDADKAA